jgi:hypothetical protein
VVQGPTVIHEDGSSYSTGDIFTRNLPLIDFLPLPVGLEIEVCEEAEQDEAVRAEQDADQSGKSAAQGQDRDQIGDDQHELSLPTNSLGEYASA